MLQTIQATIDEHGVVKLLELVHLPAKRRALLTILEDEAGENPYECYLLSEAALAKDWNRPEEDEAWASFQEAK